MYKSKNVTVAFVTAAAATFVVGCGGEEEAYCVDEDGNVVSSFICDEEADSFDDDGGHFVVYGGKLKGRRVTGGEKFRASSSEVYSRGGFGSSARSSGGGTRSTSSGG